MPDEQESRLPVWCRELLVMIEKSEAEKNERENNN